MDETDTSNSEYSDSSIISDDTDYASTTLNTDTIRQPTIQEEEERINNINYNDDKYNHLTIKEKQKLQQLNQQFIKKHKTASIKFAQMHDNMNNNRNNNINNHIILRHSKMLRDSNPAGLTPFQTFSNTNKIKRKQFNQNNNINYKFL